MKPLDSTNKKIIEILQKDSSITNADLAQKINLAPASTLERVRKLEKNGVIQKYVAIVNGEKIGMGTVVFVVVNMSEHSIETIKDFTEAVKKIPEILECHRLAGEKDYILKIVTDNIQSYEVFAFEKMAKLPSVARTSTYFVLSSIKQQTEIPISVN